MQLNHSLLYSPENLLCQVDKSYLNDPNIPWEERYRAAVEQVRSDFPQQDLSSDTSSWRDGDFVDAGHRTDPRYVPLSKQPQSGS